MYTKEFELQYHRDEKSAIDNIPNWQAKGEHFIFPEKYTSWMKTVEERANGVFHGGDLDAALEIMAKIESGASLEEAKELLMLQGHSMVSLALVRNLVYSFSILGPEFWELTALGEITPEGKAKLEAKKLENRELAQINGKDLSIFERATVYRSAEKAPQAQRGIDFVDSMRASNQGDLPVQQETEISSVLR